MQTPLSAIKPRKKCAICKYWDGDKPEPPVYGYYVVEKESEGKCNCGSSEYCAQKCKATRSCESFNLHEMYTEDKISEYGKALTHIHIQECVPKINAKTLGMCENLESITVDENNKDLCSIDGVLFSKDKKTLIKYPASRKNDEYEIPEGTERIEDEWGFQSARIKKLRLPQSLIKTNNAIIASSIEVLDIGKNSCLDALQKKYLQPTNLFFAPISYFEADEDNENFCAVDGVLYSKDMKAILAYPVNKKDHTFSVPDGVDIINKYVFINEYLRELNISKTVTHIDPDSFVYCENLEKINVDPSNACYSEDDFMRRFIVCLGIRRNVICEEKK